MTDRASVVPQLLGAAVGIVLGATLLFALLGTLRGDDASPEIAAEPSPAATSEDPVTDPSATPDDEVVAEPDEPAQEPSEEPSEPSPEPSESDAPPAAEVDPAEVSIQVLDAVGGTDGSAAARAVADELRAGGYDVVVVNRASTAYEVTTVFWSSGQAAGGRQVAAALGTSEAEPTPAEVQLSDSVDVHVVVGADQT